MADTAPGNAAQTPCKTPGAEWYLRAGDRGVCVEVEFPMSVDLTRGEADYAGRRIVKRVVTVATTTTPWRAPGDY